jgi:type II secretory pathway pseudopilin PulG
MQRIAANHERGSSLIEVLIALFILMVLMIGILSMFSMAYVTNLGSAARTEMTYKAQQVADTIRYLNFLEHANSAVVPSSTTTGLTFPLSAGGPINISALNGSALKYPYWGLPSSTSQDSAGIVDPNNMLRYSINVTIAGPNALGLMTITVAVVPNSDTSNPTGSRYIGAGIKGKEIDYVIQLPQ